MPAHNTGDCFGHCDGCGTSCQDTVADMLRARAEKAEAALHALEAQLHADERPHRVRMREAEARVKVLEAAARTVVDESRDRREGGWTAASWDAMNALDAALRGGAS